MAVPNSMLPTGLEITHDGMLIDRWSGTEFSVKDGEMLVRHRGKIKSISVGEIYLIWIKRVEKDEEVTRFHLIAVMKHGLLITLISSIEDPDVADDIKYELEILIGKKPQPTVEERMARKKSRAMIDKRKQLESLSMWLFVLAICLGGANFFAVLKIIRALLYEQSAQGEMSVLLGTLILIMMVIGGLLLYRKNYEKTTGQKITWLDFLIFGDFFKKKHK